MPEVPAHNQIVETKPIGKLTERQRRVLAAALQARIEPPLASVDAPLVSGRERELAYA